MALPVVDDDDARGSFHGVVELKVKSAHADGAAHSLLAYLSDEEQKEWTATQVATFLGRSRSEKASLERLRDSLEAIEDRHLPDRAHACKAFGNLLAKLCACTGPLALAFRVLEGGGHEDPNWAHISVGVDSKIATEMLWTQTVYDQFIKDAWANDLADDSKPWVTSAIGSICLAELICFGLDPKHSRALRQLLLPNCLCLLSQLAQHLDTHVEELGKSGDGSERISRRKKFTAVALMERCKIASRMWNGEDRFLAKAMKAVLGDAAANMTHWQAAHNAMAA
ncbi:unnamed protein product [Symbiodinium necroappetens]|uniref:Uncharacterized protein n=1 Tax=Symbiodinium necroappetens TaxID=1628268 RepID=A0A812NXG5_9DINO|nr:unnamed protein product [Symbiodinium necroappetens]